MKSLRPYQCRVRDHLVGQRRSADLSDPGLGKTLTTGERLREFRAAGVLRVLLVVAPDPVIPGWAEMFDEQWGSDVIWHDCRTGRKGCAALQAWISGSAPVPETQVGQPLHVFGTTADRLGTLLVQRPAVVPGSKKKPEPRVAWEKLDRLKSCGVGLVLDESHLYTVPDSNRARVARAFAWVSAVVMVATGTMVGRDKQGRVWGHTAIIAPHILHQLKCQTFRDFKVRYCVCTDTAGRVVSGGPMIRSIDHERVEKEMLEPQRAFTARITEAEALPDLPPLTVVRRYGTLDAEGARMLKQMRKERRVTVGPAGAVQLVAQAPNVGVAVMRCLELASGWLEGRPVHTAKLDLLQSVLDELGAGTPCSLWAVRTRTLLSAALVAAGVEPGAAMEAVAKIPPAESQEGRDACDELSDDDMGLEDEPADAVRGVKVSSPEYRAVIAWARAGGVGIMHGGTSSKARDRVLEDWRAGRLQRCVLHPGVGGAGLNLQHVSKSVYVEPCASAIQRSQSLKRHHRSGQHLPVLVYDLVMEGGPERTVLEAHAKQREAEDDLMSWMGEGAALTPRKRGKVDEVEALLGFV